MVRIRKCLLTFLMIFFKKNCFFKQNYSGRELRSKGINRIGNLLVPNDNYVKFEHWIMPIFDKMLQEQKETVHSRQ